MTISHTPAAIVKVVGAAPTPGHGDTDAKPNAEPIATRISVNATAAMVPAKIADHDTAEALDPPAIPDG